MTLINAIFVGLLLAVAASALLRGVLAVLLPLFPALVCNAAGQLLASPLTGLLIDPGGLCDDCCEEMGTVPSFGVYQLEAGDDSAEVCWCWDDDCAEAVEIAWATQTSGGGWGPVTYVTLALGTPGVPCDFNPQTIAQGGPDDVPCVNSHTITGLTPGVGVEIGINMRLRNTTLGCDGDWQSGWDGGSPFVPASNTNLLP